MTKNSNFFERLELICQQKRLRGIQELAEKLGYSSPEKLYRTGRKNDKDEYLKPSFEIIEDITNLFEDLNVRWLVNGDGQPFHTTYMVAAESENQYVTRKELEEILKKRKI